MTWTVVVLGGLGAWARAELGWACARRWGSAQPATWVVNLAGAAALGLLAGLPDSALAEETHRELALGFLGGFTTFSTWMLEALGSDPVGTPWTRRRGLAAQVVGMLVAGVAAAGLGARLGGLG